MFVMQMRFQKSMPEIQMRGSQKEREFTRHIFKLRRELNLKDVLYPQFSIGRFTVAVRYQNVCIFSLFSNLYFQHTF